MENQQTIMSNGTGKIELLFNSNYNALYSKLSPYSNYNRGLFSWGNQPFVWTSIGDKSFPNTKYDSRAFPLASSLKDVIRTSKFLASGAGIVFIAKQFLLQTGAPYNERRIWNPLSVAISAGRGATFGIIGRAERSFDTSAGLAGIASTLIGSAIPNAILGVPKVNKPFGTASDALVGGPLETSGGKGLIRAGTATAAKAHLEAAWPMNGKGLSTNKSFSSIAKSVFSTVFNNFIPQTQSGIKQRSDEGAYGLMVGGGLTRFTSTGATGREFNFGQLWIAGGKNIRKDGQVPNSYKAFITYDSNGMRGYKLVYSNIGFDVQVSGIGPVGYQVVESNDINKPGYRYGDNVGTTISDRQKEEYTHSDIMLQYANYADTAQKFPTKRSDATQIEDYNIELGKVLSNINNSSDGDLYGVNIKNNVSRVISNLHNSDPANNGYNRLFKTKNKSDKRSGVNYALGVLQDYRSVKTLDDSIGSVIPSKRFPTSGKYDAINTLTVIPRDSMGQDKSSKDKWKSMNLTGWKDRQWDPYNDDQIAVYFYDVVNENYIPFRAAIKGLSEAGNASWEEMPFIGRGDKVYSYGGFNRNVSLNINIVIGSLAELAPTWQRINYLTTLIKPANYTTSKYNDSMNRFMVPPMVMMTIGDLYKDQPVLIQSVTTTIPDDASWETQHQIGGEQWKYLADYISAPSRVLFGQLPRVVDISLGLILLEKERAVVGGANFGHAPRPEDWQGWNTSGGDAPTKLQKSMVVNVIKNHPVPKTELIDSGTPNQSRNIS